MDEHLLFVVYLQYVIRCELYQSSCWIGKAVCGLPFPDPCRSRMTSAAWSGHARSWSSCLKTQLLFMKIVLRIFLKNIFGCRLNCLIFDVQRKYWGRSEDVDVVLKCIIVISCFWLRRFISVGLFILFRVNMFSPFFGQFIIIIELNLVQ